jgi:sulfite reductase beta subunit-like hemoprotein
VDNSVDNTFRAKVNERDVWVQAIKVDAKTTQLTVKVRSGLGADIALAAEIDKQIALQLTVTP